MGLPDLPRPIPLPDRDSAPFWEAVNRHELVFQKCSGCGHTRFPVMPNCDRCLSFDFEWAPASGKGSVYSFTVAHYQAHPDLPTPYTVLLVQTDDGPRMVGRLEAPVGTAVELGDRVRIGWDDVAEQTIYHFELEG